MRAVRAQSPERGSAEAFALQPDQIAEFWHLIEPFLRRIERPDWTIEHVKAQLETAQAQLWGVQDHRRIVMVLVTKIETTPLGPRGLLWIAAGDGLETGLALFREHVESWMKARGCKSIRIIGRRGWGKVLPTYKETATMFEREL